MPDPVVATPLSEPLAQQIYPQPTNKLAVGTNVSGIVAAVSVVIGQYGNEALREVWTYIFGPDVMPALEDLVVYGILAAVAYFATQKSGQLAAFNVLDKPNQQLGLLPNTPAAAGAPVATRYAR